MSDIALVLGIRPDVIRASKIIELIDDFTIELLYSQRKAFYHS